MTPRVVLVLKGSGGTDIVTIGTSKETNRKDVNKYYSFESAVQCYFCGSYNTVKAGFNSIKSGRKQRYGCKDCGAKFTPINKLVKARTYFNSYTDLEYEKNANIGKICRLAKKTIYPFLDFNLHYTAKYKTKDYLDLFTHTAVQQDFVRNGAKTFRIHRKKSPKGHSLLYHIGKMKIGSVMEMFTKSSEEIFKLAKKSNVFKSRKLDVAIDFHDIPYWGNEKNPMLVRTKKKQGTTFAYRFATITIVEHGKRFTLLALPVSPLDRKEIVVDRLMKYAKNIISIDTVYVDRGFYSGAVIDVLKRHKVKFLMITPKNKRIKRLLRENENGAIIDFTMRKSTTFTVVIFKKDGKVCNYATNINVDNRRRIPSLRELYGKRWGIETAYRIKDHDFKARTTSRKYVVRLFYFLFCVLLYNLWVLVNLLLASCIFRFIPRHLMVTAKLFGKIFIDIEIKDPG